MKVGERLLCKKDSRYTVTGNGSGVENSFYEFNKGKFYVVIEIGVNYYINTIKVMGNKFGSGCRLSLTNNNDYNDYAYYRNYFYTKKELLNKKLKKIKKIK